MEYSWLLSEGAKMGAVAIREGFWLGPSRLLLESWCRLIFTAGLCNVLIFALSKHFFV